MHELAATKGVLEVALEAAAQAGSKRILSIDVVIGELTSMVDDSVQWCFDALSRDTPAAGAQLHFRREPATAECATCGARSAVRPPLAAVCQACGGRAVRVTGGQAFYVDSIEVADESAGDNRDPEGE
jgi:hydrogenase nickel incorporation protein HypA/HybF